MLTAFRARYGQSPFHLLLVLGSFALAGYAGVRLLEGNPFGVLVWFVGAALVHDLVLVPLYSVLDRSLRAVAARPRERRERRKPREPRENDAAAAAWRGRVNYVRVPAAVSLLLLLVWYPLILERGGHYASYTGLEPGGFMGRWLLVTAALFALSAVCLLAGALRRGRRERREDGA